MLRKLLPLVIVGVIVIIIPPVVWADSGTRQSKEAFTWKGKAPALFLRDLNGSIAVEASSGTDIEVTGTVSWKDSNPADIRFEAKPGSQGVTICALWPSDSKTTCGENGDYSVSNTKNNDLNVAFKVKLPKGTRLDSSTINGQIDIQGTTAPVKAESVNGAVHVDTASAALDVETVNGAISINIASAGAGDVKVQTVNGSIDVTVPKGFDADVSAETVNGSVVIAGQKYRHSAQVTLGKGGRKVNAETVNGSIAVN
jgi:hypothetical protein